MDSRASGTSLADHDMLFEPLFFDFERDFAIVKQVVYWLPLAQPLDKEAFRAENISRVRGP